MVSLATLTIAVATIGAFGFAINLGVPTIAAAAWQRKSSRERIQGLSSFDYRFISQFSNTATMVGTSFISFVFLIDLILAVVGALFGYAGCIQAAAVGTILGLVAFIVAGLLLLLASWPNRPTAAQADLIAAYLPPDASGGRPQVDSDVQADAGEPPAARGLARVRAIPPDFPARVDSAARQLGIPSKGLVAGIIETGLLDEHSVKDAAPVLRLLWQDPPPKNTAESGKKQQ